MADERVGHMQREGAMVSWEAQGAAPNSFFLLLFFLNNYFFYNQPFDDRYLPHCPSRLPPSYIIP